MSKMRVGNEVEMNEKHILALSSAMGELGIDKKIADVEAAGCWPVAILVPDKPEFAWTKAIFLYSNLPVYFAPVIVEPEIAYRYVENCKEGEDESCTSC